MPNLSVLISGAGPAGTVLAYWLGKHDFQVTVLERSTTKNQSGQIIDIEGPSQEIVRRMGIMDKVRADVTHEAGLTIEEESGRKVGTFPVNSSGISNEIEIMRPALNNILVEAAESMPNVSLRYGCTITRLEQPGSSRSVHVDISDKPANKTTTETFDVLVACDGLRSRTRDFILPEHLRNSCVKSLNAFVAFFSLPAEPKDRPYARACNFPGRRSLLVKPLDEKTSSAYVGCVEYDQELHDARESRDVQRQKAAMSNMFKGLGWEADRLVEGMMNSDNFYFEELSQIKLDKWHYGRCALLGDTAYSPSPLTGQGTNMAILGAYVLASKLNKHPQNPERAFEEWETEYRKYVEKVQPVPLGGYIPYIINPATSWGIWLLHLVVGWVCWSQVWKILPEIKNVPYELPELF